MRKLSCLLGAAVILLAAGCAGGAKERVYNNRDFGFAVNYPAGFQVKPLRWVKEETGVELKRAGKTVTVQAIPTGINYKKLPFDQYVAIAAAVDIQNFTRPTLIEPFTSAYNVKGYKTFWEVVRHNDSDSGEADSTEVVGPLYYFPPERERALGEQPVKAIMISADERLSAEANEVAASFRYLNSFVTLLRRPQHGQLFWAKKDRPFRIELTANPTTGYNWYIAGLDEKMFQVSRSGYNPERTGLIGSGGTSYWEITPLAAGTGTIKLLYYRVWEGAEKAVDRFQVRVLVL
jgi:predicted secreted protein